MARRSIREVIYKMNTRNKNIKIILMLIPVMLLISLCVFGMLICILQVFFDSNGSINFSRFLNVINNKTFIRSFIHTFYISIIQSLISIIISFLVSYYLLKNRINNRLLYVPISIPHIVVAMFTIYLFAKNGLISHMLHNFGIIKEASNFISIINDKYGIGVIIAYVFKSSAYCLSVIYIAMRNVNNKYAEVAKVIGVDEREYVIGVIYPLLKKTLLFCFLIIFTYSFGAYEIPFLLGSSQDKTLPILAYIEYLKPNLDSRTVSQTYNFIMFIIGIVSLLIYSTINKSVDKTYV